MSEVTIHSNPEAWDWRVRAGTAEAHRKVLESKVLILEARVRELEGAYKTCPACGKAWAKP